MEPHSALCKVASIQTGLVKVIPPDPTVERGGQPWRSGILKQVRDGRVWLGKNGLDGDRQADLIEHGGPDKAVNVYPSEHYPYWRHTLGIRAMDSGAFGENFTLWGLRETDVAIGDIFRVGDAVVQVSQPRQPCWKLARRWGVEGFVKQVDQSGFTGWYLRVLEEGYVGRSLTLTRLARTAPHISIAEANRILHDPTCSPADAVRLVTHSALSESWKASISTQHNIPL